MTRSYVVVLTHWLFFLITCKCCQNPARHFDVSDDLESAALQYLNCDMVILRPSWFANERKINQLHAAARKHIEQVQSDALENGPSAHLATCVPSPERPCNFGRFDVVPPLSKPFGKGLLKNLLQSPGFRLMERVLGGGLSLRYVSLLVASAHGREPQRLHSDGDDESSSKVLEFFVALHDVSVHGGSIELYPACAYARPPGVSDSEVVHALSVWSCRDADGNPRDPSKVKPVVPELQTGEIFIYNSRILHRGLPNEGNAYQDRILLTFGFAASDASDLDADLPKWGAAGMQTNERLLKLWNSLAPNKGKVHSMRTTTVAPTVQASDVAMKFLYAASTGDLASVKEALGRGADLHQVDGREVTPLGLAAAGGHISVMTYLLEARADLDRCGTSLCYLRPVHHASKTGHVKTLQYLHKVRADFSGAREPGDLGAVEAVHVAAIHGHSKTVKMLLSLRARLAAKSQDGEQALHYAAGKGHLPVLGLLVKQGAKIDAKATIKGSKPGWTPLHYAIYQGHSSAAAWLIQHRADPHGIDLEGRTPVELAGHVGHLKLLELLQSDRRVEL